MFLTQVHKCCLFLADVHWFLIEKVEFFRSPMFYYVIEASQLTEIDTQNRSLVSENEHTNTHTYTHKRTPVAGRRRRSVQHSFTASLFLYLRNLFENIFSNIPFNSNIFYRSFYAFLCY